MLRVGDCYLRLWFCHSQRTYFSWPVKGTRKTCLGDQWLILFWASFSMTSNVQCVEPYLKVRCVLVICFPHEFCCEELLVGGPFSSKVPKRVIVGQVHAVVEHMPSTQKTPSSSSGITEQHCTPTIYHPPGPVLFTVAPAENQRKPKVSHFSSEGKWDGGSGGDYSGIGEELKLQEEELTGFQGEQRKSKSFPKGLWESGYLSFTLWLEEEGSMLIYIFF